MYIKTDIEPFDNCPALDGYHCVTSSLAKIFYHYNHSLSEDMLLGLGAGMGFIYWQMNMGSEKFVFVGGRSNAKDMEQGFFRDIGNRTGVKIEIISTSSGKKAEENLLKNLCRKEPVMLFGDMGFLPWFDLPKDYHFGEHAFIICGFDGKDNVLISDMDQKASGLKKGFYCPISLEQLRKARASKYKPFPAKNTYLEFDFMNYHNPTANDIYSSIKQTINSLLHPPIKNIGVKGIRHTAKEILKWPKIFNNKELRMNLFNFYIFFEIGGTGGGCFRYMYSRFLKESSERTKNKKLFQTAEKIHQSGEMFSKIGLLFKDSEKAKDLTDRINAASNLFINIAELEEEAYNELSTAIE